MRPNQQNNKQRSRGRNNNNNNNQRRSGGGNPLSRNYESNGPDVKIRGNAAHIAEKYVQLARDATSVGDNVMAENYLQHAEHYFRIILAAQAQYQPRPDQSVDTSADEDEEGEGEAIQAANTPEPVAAQAPDTEQPAEPQREKRVRPRRPRREKLEDGTYAASEDTVGNQAPEPAIAQEGAAQESAANGPQAEGADGTTQEAPKRVRRPRRTTKKAETSEETVGELPAFLTAPREATAE